MAFKNVWLKKETNELLNKARVKFVKNNSDIKPYDDLIIKEALRVYVNEWIKHIWKQKRRS